MLKNWRFLDGLRIGSRTVLAFEDVSEENFARNVHASPLRGQNHSHAVAWMLLPYVDSLDWCDGRGQSWFVRYVIDGAAWERVRDQFLVVCSGDGAVQANLEGGVDGLDGSHILAVLVCVVSYLAGNTVATEETILPHRKIPLIVRMIA